MSTIFRLFFLVFSIMVINKTEAQIPYIDSKVNLENGIEEFGKGNYKKSIELYQQVNESDTNYSLAVYEQVLSLQADSSFEAAKKLALSGLKLRKSNKREFYLALAATYDYLKQSDSSLIIYDSIKKMYPNDHQPVYEEGILYFRKKNYDKALSYFQQSLLINPNHFKSHYMTGMAYAMQGRLSEALIAFETSLLMTQSADLAKQSITLISSITDGTDEVVKLHNDKPEKYSHPLFDDLDQLLLSKLALSKDYKLKMSLNDNVFRQTQVLMEKLKYDATDANFVMQFYVPLLTEVYNRDLFESYILLLFSGFGYENVDALAKKKNKDNDEIKNLVFPYFTKIQNTREVYFESRKKATEMYHYYPKDNLIIVGAASIRGDNKILTGDVQFLRGDHTLKSQGRFTNNGDKDGWWTSYFTTGGIMSREFYANKKEVDSSITYYVNGNVKNITIRDRTGEIKAEYDYEYGGSLSSSRIKLKDNNVEEKSYNVNGQMELSIVYEGKDPRDGNYTVYHANGKIRRVFVLKDGKSNGISKTYFDNGKPSEISNYVKGLLDGPFETYYETGGIKEKSTYRNGRHMGDYEEYYEDGKLSEKGIYGKEGKEEINKYSESGNIYAIIKSSDNVPNSLKSMNEDKQVMFEKEDKKGIYEYPLYHANGNKAVDMRINDKGYRHGALTFYYITGAKSEESNYTDGDLDGKLVSYFKDGRIRTVEYYTKDKKDGYSKTYYYNGNVQNEGWYKNGKRQGTWKYYYINGQLETEKYFQDDDFHGYYKEYNIHGVLTDKYIYEFGCPVGHVAYDTAGHLVDSLFFGNQNGIFSVRHSATASPDASYTIRNGYFNGPTRYAYFNGKDIKREFYKMGKKDSASISLYPDGKTRASGMYLGGYKVGKWSYYDEAGDLVKEENYNSSGLLDGNSNGYACGIMHIQYHNTTGNKDGEQIYFGENGKVAFKLIYENGNLTGYTCEGKDGKMLPVVKIKNGSANMVSYYSNGNKSGEAIFDQNTIKGTLKVYYSNGTVAEERNCRYFDLEGPFRRYNPDGKLIYDAVYKDDELEGIEKTYNKDGKLIVSATYYSGEKNGPTIVTDPVTNQSVTYYYHYGLLTAISK